MSMEIDEVMLGDIVAAGGRPIHVTLAVLNNWSDNIKPIPLTPEILEKNGFKTKKIMPFEQEFEHRVGVDGRVELDSRSEYIHSNNTWAMYIRGDRGFTSYIELSFLHQLQHALKLCGIDKEIVV